jgi:hypothetical protein
LDQHLPAQRASLLLARDLVLEMNPGDALLPQHEPVGGVGERGVARDELVAAAPRQARPVLVVQRVEVADEGGRVGAEVGRVSGAGGVPSWRGAVSRRYGSTSRRSRQRK